MQAGRNHALKRCLQENTVRATSVSRGTSHGQANQRRAKVGNVDVEALSHNMARLIEEGGKALAAYLKPREEGKIRRDAPKTSPMWSSRSAASRNTGCRILAAHLRSRPAWVAPISSYGPARSGAWPANRQNPSSRPDPRDKRFADPEWSQNQFFDFLKQAYLLGTQWAERLVKDAAGVDETTRKKAEFYVKQIANAVSPSNFVLTNPELLRETLASNGENLVRGMHMLSEDIKAGQGTLKIRQSDPSMFEVGRNLAVTPGKVVFPKRV